MRDPHVRFDERGWETGRCRMAQVTAPILDSTIPAPSIGRLASIRPTGSRWAIPWWVKEVAFNPLHWNGMWLLCNYS
jgi:hypothetical protein